MQIIFVLELKHFANFVIIFLLRQKVLEISVFPFQVGAILVQLDKTLCLQPLFAVVASCFSSGHPVKIERREDGAKYK